MGTGPCISDKPTFSFGLKAPRIHLRALTSSPKPVQLTNGRRDQETRYSLITPNANARNAVSAHARTYFNDR